MQDKQLATYLALDQAYKSGNVLITDRVEAIVAPQEVELPEQLQSVIDNLKDTPILEPELYAILEKDNGMLLGFMDELSKLVNLDDFDPITASEFVSRARLKIISKTDKNGVYKSTPNIDTLPLPKMSVVRKLAATLISGSMNQEEFSAFAVSLAVLPDGVKLTHWEKGLITEMFTQLALSTVNQLSGKAQDRTPFSRYLKNV